MDITDELTTNNICAMITQIASLKIGNIVFSGGEPLLRDDLFEIIAHASSRGINNTILLTNGTIISNEIIEKINNSGLKSIWVSIDGLEDNHDYIRGKGSFKKSMRFIEMIIERCPNVLVNIATTIMNRNLEDIPRLLQFWEKMKIERISLQPVIFDNTDWTNKEKNDALWIPEHRLPLLDKIVDEIITFKKRKDIISTSYSFLGLIKHYFKGDLNKMKRKLYCYEGFKRFTITAGGRVWICGTEMKSSIVENGLNRCWNSYEVRKKRREMLRCRQLCLQACSFE